ncbi:hypothetical protein Sjap_023987 [Stephania japonica]|uniref:Uncharacterized protein n=1 Tax=Stephania japonica TaxID=461633 RepID=A0AAP0HPQ8_9MAGN
MYGINSVSLLYFILDYMQTDGVLVEAVDPDLRKMLVKQNAKDPMHIFVFMQVILQN